VLGVRAPPASDQKGIECVLLRRVLVCKSLWLLLGNVSTSCSHGCDSLLLARNLEGVPHGGRPFSVSLSGTRTVSSQADHQYLRDLRISGTKIVHVELQTLELSC